MSPASGLSSSLLDTEKEAIICVCGLYLAAERSRNMRRILRLRRRETVCDFSILVFAFFCLFSSFSRTSASLSTRNAILIEFIFYFPT